MRSLRESCGCESVETRSGALKSGIMRLLVLLLVVLSCHGCPDRCLCSSQTVKCQNQDLDNIPRSLPSNTKILFVTGNNISRLTVDSFPNSLEMLTDLYLSGNELESVGEMVFDNLPNLVRLDLSNNKFQAFSDRAFPDDNKLQMLNLSKSFHDNSSVEVVLNVLQSGKLLMLKVLDLSNNNFLILPEDTFRSLSNLVNLSLQNSSIISIQNGTLKVPPLHDLDLRDNSLKYLSTTALAEFDLKPGLRIWLAGNPWRCDCIIEDMLMWLKNSSQVVDVHNLTCTDPEALRRRRLLQVEPSKLKCSGDMEGVLETSYVFLGLVLALIGLIFLLVLYLNRKGIKRWMYNIRDACRDHMEGYHYRYEINSDPRLANLSINSDV
ncbi:trophoblast glycoprotein [Solea senegalensis]|uniref:Trophoblast glycoprotein n=1 Tax=Solea senegalensis TaxID=28829 RepID=A0AAV6PT06_SOLSE|nr:trophoblast glycoprotein b [Solea senegalensis]KAG7474497.1 trophoblast glycoprotein [Solea senegalensis]